MVRKLNYEQFSQQICGIIPCYVDCKPTLGLSSCKNQSSPPHQKKRISENLPKKILQLILIVEGTNN